MSDTTQALRSSVTSLAKVVERLEANELNMRAYPAEWSIADTLSHLGSGAVISAGMLDFARRGHPIPDDYMPGVWDEWNAKSPESQASDLIPADQACLEAFESVDDAEGASLRLALGDHGIDFATFAQHRLNEHVLHSWDVRVAIDPTATLPVELVPAMLDGLGSAASSSGKPVADERTVIVHTFDPSATFRVELGPDVVILEPEANPGTDLAELHLPGEALIRLVYGRMDTEHTPVGVGGSADVAEFRRIFTGF